jgi:diacylglycerol kinase
MSSPNPIEHEAKREWGAKFCDAYRGIAKARRGDKSFAVHQLAMLAVIVAGVLFDIDRIEWCVLIICMAVVVAAETFNSSIEALAKAVTSEHNENVGKSLDMAAGAVLLAAIGAAIVGLCVFVPRIIALMSS